MQTKKGSIFETSCNVFSGLVTAYFTWQYIILPMAHANQWDMNKLIMHQIFITNLCFTTVSVVRGYLWRRLFNSIEAE